MVLLVWVMGTMFTFSQPVLAPPRAGGPKPAGKPAVHKPAGPAKHKPVAHKPRYIGPQHPKVHHNMSKPPKHLKRKPLYKHHLYHHPRYWHPYHVKVTGRPYTVWSTIGYPYYVGGTSYVIDGESGVSDESDSTASESSPGYPLADDGYIQMQELADLIHEWRTLNESPEVHERIQSADETDTGKTTVASIRTCNKEFDKTARTAMLLLTQGKSAESQIEIARTTLAKLAGLVESLPEV